MTSSSQADKDAYRILKEKVLREREKQGLPLPKETPKPKDN